MQKLTFAIRKKAVFLLFFGSLGVLPAQVAEDDVIRQERQIGTFTAIDVEDGINVYLQLAERTSVWVRAEDYLVPKLKTELFGTELKISLDGYYRKPQTLEVHIELPRLESIVARGGSDIYAKGSFRQDQFRIVLSEGSDLCLDLVARTVSCFLSGGSDAKLSGKVTYFTADTKGVSRLEAEALEVQNCKLAALGGSEAFIWVIGELEMEANQSSGIFYQGNPKILSQKASGDSDIRPM